jgi:hypothetical protein
VRGSHALCAGLLTPHTRRPEVSRRRGDLRSGIRRVRETRAERGGFEDATNGAGIRVYWVLDEEEASPYEVFADDSAMTAWANAHRNSRLGEFVHLMFADRKGTTDLGGSSFTWGAYDLLWGEWKWWNDHAQRYVFHDGLAHTAAHELTHCLINPNDEDGFDPDGHLPDPNENGVPDDPPDEIYLMYRYTTPRNEATIIFSGPTRRQLDLTSKWSVER